MAFFRVATEDNKLSLNNYKNILKPFHPAAIQKDRERAYYSTPKKYRKRMDHSPNVNKSVASFTLHKRQDESDK